MTFDQAAARALIGSYHPNFVLPYEIRELKAALAEIERLQAENERLMTPNACDDWGNPLVLSVSGSCEDAQAKRIAELEGSAKADESRLIAAAKKAGIEYFGCDTPDHLADRVVELNVAAMNGNELAQSLMANCNSLRSRAQKAEARAAELEADVERLTAEEKELISEFEERASHLLCHDRPCDAEDGDSGDCAEADHQCCWEICTKKEEKRQIARQQLRQEGVL